ncbi:hypothetical protein Tco_0524450 [Tanacetum coccineum]
MVPSDDEAPIEDQPLSADASPTTLSLGYVADSDPEEDPSDYPTDRGDDDDEEESSRDDADDEDEEKASEDEDEEEEEHLAPADSPTLPAVDLVPLAEDTEAFEKDESTPTPPVPSPRLHSQAMEAQIRALQRDVDILQWQRIRDEDRLMSHIQHEHDKFKELVRTVETGPQDGPADVGSSC